MDLFKTDLLRQHPRPRRAAYTERPRRPGCRSATTARPAPAALCGWRSPPRGCPHPCPPRTRQPGQRKARRRPPPAGRARRLPGCPAQRLPTLPKRESGGS